MKNKHSNKYKELNSKYLVLRKQTKQIYYAKIVSGLHLSHVSKWYSKIKQISGLDSCHDIEVDEIKNLTIPEQCEVIARQFSAIANSYSPLQSGDINVESAKNNLPIPTIHPWDIHNLIEKSKSERQLLKGKYQ